MFAWEYHPVLDLDDAPSARLARVPREPDLLVSAFRTIVAVAIRAALRVYCRLGIVGRENLPGGGASFVMVANHASHIDAPCLLSALPLSQLDRAYPAAAKDYFFRSPSTTALAATLINALPFDRAGGVRHSMGVCRELLRNDGNVLIVFPEGTRSTDGTMGAFRRGVGDLVAGTSVPVVPCFLDGARAAWPKGAVVPRPRRVRLLIGRPRTYKAYEPCKSSARAIGDDLRRAVLALAPTARQPMRHASLVEFHETEGGSYDGCGSPAVPAAATRPAGAAA